MSIRNEEFIHFDKCIERLNEAWMTFKLVREHQGHPLAGPGFRFALVSYAAPYTSSEGIHKRRHTLDSKYVPAQFAALHARLIQARHSVHAHTDLSVLDARLSFSDISGQRLVSTAQNYISGLEEFGNLEDIVLLIEGTLNNMYADRERLKSGLEP